MRLGLSLRRGVLGMDGCFGEKAMHEIARGLKLLQHQVAAKLSRSAAQQLMPHPPCTEARFQADFGSLGWSEPMGQKRLMGAGT